MSVLSASLRMPDATERRSTLRLYKSWDAARGRRDLPSLSEFDLALLEQIGGVCFLLELGSKEGIPKFRYFGRDLAVETGRDLTGCPISDAPQSSLLMHVAGNFGDAVERRKAITLSGAYFQSPGPQRLYRAILLPFSTDGNTVDAVLGLFRSRAAREPARPLVSTTPSAPTTRCPELGGVAVAETRSVAAADPVVEHRAVTKGARRSIGNAEIEEPSRTSAARRVSSAIADAWRGTLWPSRAVQLTRTAPAIGRAVLWQDAASPEFVLLLARKADMQEGRYEVVAVGEPMLLNLAMRLGARKLARSGFEDDEAGPSLATVRFRNGQMRQRSNARRD